MWWEGRSELQASGAPQKALLPRALPAIVRTIAIIKHKILTKTLDKRVLVYYLCVIELFSLLLGHSKQTSILEVDVCFIYAGTSRCCREPCPPSRAGHEIAHFLWPAAEKP